jgi:type I restriction enzyme S subunit
LIEEHCPGGVEHKALGEVGTFVRGSGLQKKDFVDKGVGCIHYGQVYTHYGISATQPVSFVTPEFASNKRKVLPGDVFIATTSENDEDLGKAVAWLGDDAIVASGDAYIYKHSLDAKYVAYFLNSTNFQQQKQKWISGTKVRRIAGNALERIVIPLPPLPVQQEIVRILDMFTQLEAELEAELEARKLQYEHYKSEAFEFSPEAVQVPLGELVDILQGFAFKSSLYVESGIRIVRISDVQKGTMSDKDLKYYPESAANEIERYKLNAGDLVMSLSGSVGRVAMLTEADLPAALNQRVACIRPSTPRVITRYLFHYLNTNRFEQEAIASTSGGTVKNLSSRWLKEIFIPLPTIEVQKRVVSVLDQFDALVNDLNVGLPAELVARRNQYEYYRDQLLTFKELSV